MPEHHLRHYCEVKNQISQWGFDNYERPSNHDFIVDLYVMAETISQNDVLVDQEVLKKASKDSELEELFQDTNGETAIAFLGDNYVEATKTFIEIQKEYPSLAIKLGFIEGKHLNESELEEISKLPSREILLSKLLSQLKQPISGFLNVSKAIPMKLVILLNNLKNKK